MDTGIPYAKLENDKVFTALDAARVWGLKRNGWQVHATGGSQHVIGDTTYWWCGEERGGDPAKPFVIAQFTLSGWGFFEQGGTRYRIGAGEGFLAVVPSAHLYYLPAASPDWRFLWLDVWHPYAVSRLTGIRNRFGPKLSAPADSDVMCRMIAILQRLAFDQYPDDYALEEDLLRFVVQLERQMMQTRYPVASRDTLLREVRDLVHARFPHPLSVGEVARHYRKSRTRFSQIFKKTTGLAPAHFMETIRLAAAANRLESGNDKLEVIARAVGYRSATQFCKAFRKIYAFSPGAYRSYYVRKV